MHATSQFPIQTTKFFYSCFDVQLCPPHHFEKGSATHAQLDRKFTNWIDGSQSLKRSRILKFKNFLDLYPDPHSENW